MYNTFKDFTKRFGVNTTNNIQLLNWGKMLKIKNLQVLMIDEIKNANKTLPINIIVNIQKSNQKGIHWSCFHQSIKGERYWFDSYGLDPEKEIIKTFGTPILSSTFIIQDFSSSYCGQMSLYVLYRLNENIELENKVLKLTENAAKKSAEDGNIILLKTSAYKRKSTPMQDIDFLNLLLSLKTK